MPNALNGVYPDGSCQLLEEDGEPCPPRVRAGGDGNRSARLVVLPAAEHPSPSGLDRLGLRDEPGRRGGAAAGACARRERAMLALEDATAGELVDRLLGVQAGVILSHYAR